MPALAMLDAKRTLYLKGKEAERRITRDSRKKKQLLSMRIAVLPNCEQWAMFQKRGSNGLFGGSRLIDCPDRTSAALVSASHNDDRPKFGCTEHFSLLSAAKTGHKSCASWSGRRSSLLAADL